VKRTKNLYDEICSFSNLLLAAKMAQRGKRHQPGVAAFNHDLEGNLLRVQQELIGRAYVPGAYRTFKIRDPKTRLISAAPYRDRVVHHALCNVVEPIFERVFIHDSYANRKGKGTHAAVDRLTHFMQNADYCLKCDIFRYFPAIDHAILKGLLRRKVGCEGALWLADTLIDGSNHQEEVNLYFAGDDLFEPFERRRGLPIGNQPSQFFANVYLNPLDHFVKEQLGCRAYIRYVDDFVVLSDDKAELHRIYAEICDFLGSNLRLRIHPRKHSVVPVTTGVDFLGYRIYPDHRLLRRSSGFRFARNLRKMQIDYQCGRISQKEVTQRVVSWIGHASHADTYGLRTALFDRAVFRRAQA